MDHNHENYSELLEALVEAQVRARFFHNMHTLLTSGTVQIPKNSGKIQLYVKELSSKSNVFVSCPSLLLMPWDPAFCGGTFSRCS